MRARAYVFACVGGACTRACACGCVWVSVSSGCVIVSVGCVYQFRCWVYANIRVLGVCQCECWVYANVSVGCQSVCVRGVSWVYVSVSVGRVSNFVNVGCLSV